MRQEPKAVATMVERRQVLFLIPSLQGGGAERVIATLLRHLDRTKFRVALAVVNMRDAVFLSDVPEDVELIDLDSSRVRYALAKIVRLIWKRRPDVVLSTLGHLNLALAILRPFLPNDVRYVARETIMVSASLPLYRMTRLWSWGYRFFYRRFDMVICQTDVMRDDLVGNYRLPSGKAAVIHNPVDAKRIRQLATAFLPASFERAIDEAGCATVQLVSAGRLSHQKGFDVLIEALALCRNPDLRLTILGDGPLRGDLERLAAEQGVAQQVRFLGFQENPYPFFANADAFVLSSRFEGFPNVVLEALACGTPIVATPAVGGIKEILEAVGGCVLAESVTAAGLARALEHVPRGRRLPEAVVAPYAMDRIARCYEHELSARSPSSPHCS